MRVSYHASHEQFAPARLRPFAAAAIGAGFDALASSDHLAPWSDRDGVCGAAWPWMAAVMAGTSAPMSVVTTPGWRYPTLVLAQSIATMADLYPGRFSATIGSGEALNEFRFADPWPGKPERNRLLRERLETLDALLHGERLGDGGRLHLVPDVPPRLSAAAVTASTAGWIGSWWPSLTTVGDMAPATRERVDAFRQALGDRGHVTIKLQVSVAPDRATAVELADREWAVALLSPEELSELRTPAEFERRAAATVDRAKVELCIPPVTSAAELADTIDAFAEYDCDTLIVHDVAPEQSVIPLYAELRGAARP